MPLIVMCGLPSSGKTRRTEEIVNYFENQCNIKVHVVNDISENFDKNVVFSDSKQEKQQRADLKSAAQRLLNKDDLVVIDSLNYIKGFRYELFCVVKSARTPHCLIYCDVSKTQAEDFNFKRAANEKYKEDTLRGLIMRFEPPNSQNRWDSPLFVAHPDEELPLKAIYDALYLRKAPPPNMSTQSAPLASTNFVHELDRLTQDIVNTIMESQKTCVVGDTVTISGSDDKIILQKILTLAELQRCKRQFIKFTKSRAIDTLHGMPNMFVHFINNSMQ